MSGCCSNSPKTFSPAVASSCGTSCTSNAEILGALCQLDTDLRTILGNMQADALAIAQMNSNLDQVREVLAPANPASVDVFSDVILAATETIASGARQISFVNTSDTLDATVNGATLAPGGFLSISLPFRDLTLPEVEVTGNADGLRIDVVSF